MRCILIIVLSLFSVVASAGGIDSSIYFKQRPVNIMGNVQKGINLRNSILQQKLQQEQIKQVQAQNVHAQKPPQPEADQTLPVIAKIKVTYKNNEVKNFEFSNSTKENQPLALGSKQFYCAVSFAKGGELTFAELSCMPKQKSRTLRLFTIRASCSRRAPIDGNIFLRDAPYSHKASDHTYLILMTCE